MGVDLINGEFDLPPFVIGLDQEVCCNGAGVKQGGNQAMNFLMANSIGIIDGVFDDPHEQRSALLFAWGILRTKVGQITSIAELAHIGGDDTTVQPRQHMGTQRSDGLKQTSMRETTIKQDEHAWSDLAQEGKGQM